MQNQSRSAWGALILVGTVGLLCRSQTQPPPLPRNPDANTLKIELLQRDSRNPSGELVARPSFYKRNEQLYFAFQMTNMSNEALLIRSGNPYSQNRPELIKDGQPLPYLETVRQKIERLGDTSFSDHDIGMDLKPGESKNLGGLDLKDWYGDLEAGHYSLSVRHRDFGETWIESTTITFDMEENEAK
jgi:hypothetical protein